MIIIVLFYIQIGFLYSYYSFIKLYNENLLFDIKCADKISSNNVNYKIVDYIREVALILFWPLKLFV